jgi:5-methylcytosine-specific restriction endonuclease McrA
MLEGLKQWRGSEEYRQRIEERKAALQKIKDDAKRIKTEKINAKALTHDLIGIIGMFRKCIVCDACMGHMALTQRSARHCSDECKNAVAKARRRSHKQRYRAKLKLARVERVIDISVFKRDNWLCYICGCHCPSDLAGTNHPRAPTIDHLIPISKGGEHSMRNIKLACRECNSLKSDRIIV